MPICSCRDCLTRPCGVNLSQRLLFVCHPSAFHVIVAYPLSITRLVFVLLNFLVSYLPLPSLWFLQCSCRPLRSNSPGSCCARSLFGTFLRAQDLSRLRTPGIRFPPVAVTRTLSLADRLKLSPPSLSPGPGHEVETGFAVSESICVRV